MLTTAKGCIGQPQTPPWRHEIKMRMRTSPDNQPELKEEKGAFAEIKRNWLLILILIGGAVGAYFVFKPEPEITPQVSAAATWAAPAQASQIRNVSFLTKSGRGASVADFYGRPKVIVGYRLECEPCLRSLKSMDALAKQYAGKVDFIALAFSTRPGALTELIQKHYGEHGITYLQPYTILEEEAEGVFNSSALPHTYVVTADNRVARIHTGEGSWMDERVVA
ncbi:MAG: TlpA disulfide reductase family protein, partial [Pseudomonadota bacterium]